MISSNPQIIFVKKNTNIFYKIKNKIMKKISSYKSNEYLKTFILGDTSSLKKDVKQGYSNLGISHLFAISGMHVSLFLLFLNNVFKKFKYKDVVIFFFLLFFLFLTNFCESLLRCITFIFLSWLNKKLKLGIKNELLIVVTTIMLILINPYLIYNTGFIFSVTITFFIILSSNLFKEKGYLLKLLSTSVICFLASIPILAFSFFKINILSVVYNIIFIPLISFFYFPFALITFIFPIFDDLYYELINILQYVVLKLSNIKLLTFVVSKPNFIIIIIYYVLLFLSIKINKKYIILFFIVLLININSRFFINNTRILFLDVGQADSIIITFSKGRSIMIDTAGVYKKSGSIVENKIVPYLNSIGVSELQTLILTHGDYDHMAEAINLIDKFKINEVIFNCYDFNNLELNLIKKLNKKKIPYYSCVEKLNINNKKLYFLNTKKYDNENDNSNVIYSVFSNYKFLFMGDASIDKEKDILKKYNLSNIDVLKVGHHGSKTSSSKEFIDSINPKYSVISVGENNRYNHPNYEVLENLNGSKIYRTDQNGSVMFKIKNNKLTIKTYAP